MPELFGRRVSLNRLQSRSLDLSDSSLRLRRIQSLFLLILQTLYASMRRHLSFNGSSGIPIEALYRYHPFNIISTITTVIIILTPET